jgi:hypothetical protein
VRNTAFLEYTADATQLAREGAATHTCASYVYQVLIRSGQVAGSALNNVTATSAWRGSNGEIEEVGGIGVGAAAACCAGEGVGWGGVGGRGAQPPAPRRRRRAEG